MHIQAVSARSLTRPFAQEVFQSAGHPDHADGTIVGGTHDVESTLSRVTPWGSPATAVGGPTVAGVTAAGSFAFGSDGGRIDLENQAISAPSGRRPDGGRPAPPRRGR